MDAQGTRFHLLLGEGDWMRHEQPPQPPDAITYDVDREELRLARRAFRFRARPGDRAPRPSDRRGSAADAFGNVYWIDASRRTVRVLSTGSGLPSLFAEPTIASAAGARHPVTDGGFGPQPTPAPPPPACLLAGLAVTDDHHLVVGTVDPAGLLVFDLHAPQTPRRVLWPADVAFEPFDMCARSGGGVFVLDRRRARLWELDGRLAVVSRSASALPSVPPTFAPAAPISAPTERQHSWRARPVEADALVLGGDPLAVEAAPGGRVLVLDRNADQAPSTVRLFLPGQPDGGHTPLSGGPVDDPVHVVGQDMALVPTKGPGLGTLYVADREGNQSYAFELSAAPFGVRLVEEYLPMRLFGGAALVTRRGVVHYDIGDTWIPLVAQRTPTFAPSCRIRPTTFDARVPATVWHRLMLDACIPPGARVVVHTRAADELADLAVASWQPEPPLVYRRTTGSELPFLPDPRPDYGTYEVLFQRARGRYLQLTIELSGDGRVSPRLTALRASYPRPSYLEYLPRAYREDRDSASFLDRFLANVEGIATGIEDRIAAAQALFDPRSAPIDALDWLLGWFDVAADPAWTGERRRLFIRHAMDFFSLRGTVAGVELALRFALDPCLDETTWDRRGTARVREAFRTRLTPATGSVPAEGAQAPRVGAVAALWDPTQGRDDLRDRWRSVSGDPVAEFPTLSSDERWRAFVRQVIGFDPPPEVPPEAWTAFLAGRYATVDALATAYGLIGQARPDRIDVVSFPAQLPLDGAALRDWYQFLGVVVPTRAAAHRFTVLLPVALGNDDVWSPAERKAIAERVVAVQKPAHTVFDVRFFWAAFRLGQARLGEDTELRYGGRDPALHPALVLGREYAGESHLGGSPAPVVGGAARDPRLGTHPTTTTGRTR